MTMKTVGMDIIWMPVLEQSCMELIERQRHGEPDRGPGPDKVGVNKRHRRISVRGGGIRTEYRKVAVPFSFITREGVCMLSSVPIGAHLTHHCTRQLPQSLLLYQTSSGIIQASF